MSACPHCHQRLIEIDHYGERLIGCIECNRWGRPGDTTLPMQLLGEELEALGARRRRAQSHHAGILWTMAELQCALGRADVILPKGPAKNAGRWGEK